LNVVPSELNVGLIVSNSRDSKISTNGRKSFCRTRPRRPKRRREARLAKNREKYIDTHLLVVQDERYESPQSSDRGA
jgi:hypothetical protein